MANAFVGDIGTVVSIDLGEDLADVVDAKMIIRKPSSTEAVVVDGLVDGQEVQYVIVDGDFSEAGTYQFQAYVEFASWSGYSTIAEHTVLAVLADAS